MPFWPLIAAASIMERDIGSKMSHLSANWMQYKTQPFRDLVNDTSLPALITRSGLRDKFWLVNCATVRMTCCVGVPSLLRLQMTRSTPSIPVLEKDNTNQASITNYLITEREILTGKS